LKPPSERVSSTYDSDRQNLKINFTLPYDRELARMRQLNRLIQVISIPVFAAGSAATFYVRSAADKSFLMYKHAETETAARSYYDRTLKLDKLIFIPATISVTSLYGFIHSTIKKKSITEKMRKTF
jgi:hypothetical protein